MVSLNKHQVRPGEGGGRRLFPLLMSVKAQEGVGLVSWQRGRYGWKDQGLGRMKSRRVGRGVGVRSPTSVQCSYVYRWGQSSRFKGGIGFRGLQSHKTEGIRLDPLEAGWRPFV